MNWTESAQQAARTERELGETTVPWDLCRARLTTEGPPSDSPARKVHDWELKVFSLRFRADDEKGAADRRKRHTLDGVFENGASLPKADDTDFWNYVEARLAAAAAPAIRAHLHDLLWLAHHDVTHANDAISEYLRAAPLLVTRERNGGGAAHTCLKRAASLVGNLGRERAPVREGVAATIRGFSDQKLGQALRVVRFFAKDLRADPGLHAEVFGRLTKLREETTRRAAGAERAPFGQDRHEEQALLEALIDISGGKERAALGRLLVESHMSEAVERREENPHLGVGLLRNAVEKAQRFGFADLVAKIKPLWAEASRHSAGNLKTIATSYAVVPVAEIREPLEKLLAVTRQTSPFEHLHVLAARSGLWPNWDVVREELEEGREVAPLLHDIPMTSVTTDGQVHSSPKSAEEREEHQEIMVYLRRVQFDLIHQKRQIEELRNLGAWSAELLCEALGCGAVFDEDMLARTKPGLVLFEEQRFWEALHVLIPQVERAIRHLAQRVGVPVEALTRSGDKLQWSPLGSFLNHDALRHVLRSLSDAADKELALLLDHPAGLNLRNDVAHGVVPFGNAPLSALVAVNVLLTLSLFRATPREAQRSETAAASVIQSSEDPAKNR